MKTPVPTFLIGEPSLIQHGLEHILCRAQFRVVAKLRCSRDLEKITVPCESGLVLFEVRGTTNIATEIHQIRVALPSYKIVMLADAYAPSELVAALTAGADSYLLASTNSSAFLKCIELIVAGEFVVAAEAKALISGTPRPVPDIEPPSSADEPPDRFADAKNTSLSVREHEILQCLIEGNPNKVIARRFDISTGTVKVHLRAIMRKIHVSNRTQAAIWAAVHLYKQTGDVPFESLADLCIAPPLSETPSLSIDQPHSGPAAGTSRSTRRTGGEHIVEPARPNGSSSISPETFARG